MGILSADITFDSQAGLPPASIEWTLGFPTSQFSQIVAGPVAVQAGKTVQCTGQYAIARCLLIGSNANSMASGVIATVHLAVLPTANVASPLILSNITAASPSGDAMTVQGDGTTVSLSSPPVTTPPGTVFQTGSMAHVVSGGVWKSTITLVNTGSSPALTELDFFDNSGQPLPLPLRYLKYPVTSTALGGTTLTQVLDPGSVVTLESSAPEAETAAEGWAKMSTTGTVRGFVIFTHTGNGHEAAVPLQLLDSRPQVLPFDNTDPVLTGLAVANVSASPVSVAAVIRNDQGNQIGTDSIDLPPLGHTSFMLSGRYGATAGLRGTVQFSSPGQFSAIGLRAKWNAISTLPFLTTGSSTGQTPITHIAAGGGWKTSFTLVNLADVAKNTSLHFFEDFGGPLSTNMTYVQTGAMLTGTSTSDTLAPKSSLLLDALGTDSDNVSTGSSTLTGDVAGFGVFTFAPTGEEAVVPLETRNLSSYVLAYDNTGGTATGLALANASGTGGYLQLTFRDEAGTVLATALFNLFAHGHASFLLADRFSITAGRRGTIEAAAPSGGLISMIGLRATPAGTFTTLPVLEKGN